MRRPTRSPAPSSGPASPGRTTPLCCTAVCGPCSPPAVIVIATAVLHDTLSRDSYSAPSDTHGAFLILALSLTRPRFNPLSAPLTPFHPPLPIFLPLHPPYFSLCLWPFLSPFPRSLSFHLAWCAERFRSSLDDACRCRCLCRCLCLFVSVFVPVSLSLSPSLHLYLSLFLSLSLSH